MAKNEHYLNPQFPHFFSPASAKIREYIFRRSTWIMNKNFLPFMSVSWDAPTHLFLYSCVSEVNRSTIFIGVFPVPVYKYVCVPCCTCGGQNTTYIAILRFYLVWDRVSLLYKGHSPGQLVKQLFLPPISA